MNKHVSRRLYFYVLAVLSLGTGLAPFCHADNLDLNVPGPDFSAAAKKYADAPPKATPDRPLIHLPAETHGFDVHGSVSAGVMAGSHHTSGQYTAGQVDLTRDDMQFSVGVSQMTMHGRGYGPHHYDTDGFGSIWGP